ncbi:YqjF family protein [Streptomyces collinus]|uniref:YqjF family protein n=1 Tax=Streptomyces collinus TaxID=42684 RepID=UPI003F54131D
MRVVSYGPEQRVYLPALRAGWLTQTFVHWAVPPERVQRLLPGGLTVDTYDGAAWVSLTPFVMAGVRPLGLPAALPGLPSFPETNLRTYVRGPDGRDGVWFLSLEVGSPLMLAVRAIGAPYHVGRLAVSRRAGVVTYSGSRRGAGPAYHLTVRPGDPVRPTPRDVWLTSRWRAYTRRFGVLWESPVEHEPWQLRAVRVDFLRETLTRAVGLPPAGTAPLAHFSDGVRSVRMGGSRPVGRVHDRTDRLGARSAAAR